MADNVSVKIDEQVKGNKVIVYMKGKKNFPQCGFSAHTVEILQSYGYPFETVDVLEDPAIREEIKQFSNWPTIPQIEKTILLFKGMQDGLEKLLTR